MKISIRFLAIVLAMLTMLVLAACGDTAEDTTAGTDGVSDTSAPIETEDLSGDDGDTYTQMDYMTSDLDKYITLGEYKGIDVVAIRPIVTEAQIDGEIQALIDADTKYEPYEVHVTDRVTERGDFVNIDYVGTMDGEPFEGGSNEGDSVVLAENNGYIDWFEDDLYGVMPGTTVVSTGKFPDDYHEHLAGKEVTFTITVNYIAGHYTIPEFNDEYVKEMVGAESVAEFREMMREYLQAESDASHEMNKYQIMWGQILDGVTVKEYPREQVMFYYTSQRSSLEAYAAQYGYTYDEYLAQAGVDDSYILEMMEARVKEELAFYAIVKAEGLEVTQEDYANGILQYAADQGMSESELVEQYGEEYIKECVLWDKLMVYLAANTTFIEE